MRWVLEDENDFKMYRMANRVFQAGGRGTRACLVKKGGGGGIGKGLSERPSGPHSEEDLVKVRPLCAKMMTQRLARFLEWKQSPGGE